MPIRFRCKACKQLLGIARRKSGTWVSCPTCRNNVLVPANDEPDDLPEPQPVLPEAPKAAPAGLFDRDDFDVLLAKGQPPVSAPPPRGGERLPAPPPPRAAYPPEPAPAPSSMHGSHQWSAPPPGGLVLSPGRATLLTVVLILLLASSFVVGLLVGRFAL